MAQVRGMPFTSSGSERDADAQEVIIYHLLASSYVGTMGSCIKINELGVCATKLSSWGLRNKSRVLPGTKRSCNKIY